MTVILIRVLGSTLPELLSFECYFSRFICTTLAVTFGSLSVFEFLQGPHHCRHDRHLSGLWSGTTFRWTSIPFCPTRLTTRCHGWFSQARQQPMKEKLWATTITTTLDGGLAWHNIVGHIGSVNWLSGVHYLCIWPSHWGQLSLDIYPWVGWMSSGDGYRRWLRMVIEEETVSSA